MGLRRSFRNFRKKISPSYSKRHYQRADFLKSIPEDLNILEIGPFFNPTFKGPNVKFFDVWNRQDLEKKAKKLDSSFKVENIPDIDYVSPDADLTIIDEKFDAVFSSHVIEHQFDLIDHLQKVSQLVVDGGKYYLVVPDKRYCFDHFQQLSTIADVIDAHIDKRKRHKLKSIIENHFFTTHNDPKAHWKGKHGKIAGKASSIKDAIAEYRGSEYVDSHAQFFTPGSFLEIMSLLYEMEFIPFKVERHHETAVNSLEFYCVLVKKANKVG